MDHRVSAMRVALTACLNARLTANTAIGIDEEFEVCRDAHNYLKRTLLLWLQFAVIRGSTFCLLHTTAAHLVLGNLTDRVLRRDGQLIGAFLAGPVIGD